MASIMRPCSRCGRLMDTGRRICFDCQIKAEKPEPPPQTEPAPPPPAPAPRRPSGWQEVNSGLNSGLGFAGGVCCLFPLSIVFTGLWILWLLFR
jgi:hypothetical protein